MTEEIIKILGGATILVAAVSWLFRSLTTHLLSKDIEIFRQQLVENQKRFGTLHEKRANIIEELYSKLIDFLGAAESFSHIAEWQGEPSKEEKAIILGEKAGEFRAYYLKNKIYFNKDICETIDSLFGEVYKKTLIYRVHLAHKKEGVGDSKLFTDAWMDAWKFMQDKSPVLLEAIQTEFRSILGVK